ncbi:MAG TPA: hypothetical protein VLH79_09315 [Chthonomonadales bacterium]|nr:hypothetical protein [Chthonomonadales bacterium]
MSAWLLLAIGLLAVLAEAAPAQAAPRWKAIVSPAGSVRIERDGQIFGTMDPGLFEFEWRGVGMGPGTVGAAPPAPGQPRAGRITAPGGAIVDVETRVEPAPGGVRFHYRMTPRAALRLNSLHVSLSMPAMVLAGGAYRADGSSGTVPRQFRETGVFSAPIRQLELVGTADRRLAFAFAAETPVLLQDDRQWGPSFSLRMGPQPGGEEWPAGRALVIDFTLTAPGGIALEHDGPVTIEAGPDWLPLDVELDIVPNSALDLGSVIPWHSPAGSLGRVVATPAGFAFASRPDQPVRFYGVNLCFSAHFITHEQSDRLAERLWRLGYNTVRFHHHEGGLVDRSGGDSTRLAPQALDQLDYLFYALKRRGIYIATDLYVSRPVFRHEVWEGEQGNVGMDEFKMAVPVNERAFANFVAFTRNLLNHRNPHTGLRWAEDPALAWINLINEGNPGNFFGNLSPSLRRDYERAWNAWLARRYRTAEELRAAIGDLSGGRAPDAGDIPLPAGVNDTPAGLALSVFLAENQRDFTRRMRQILRDELGSQALISNLNAWTNPIQMHTVRREFDFVDDHYYIDHPEFLERPWSLPSRSPNTSPVAAGAPGGRGVTFLRLLDRPFTITEFNYSAPGRFRGVGGILTGALGAIQDWSGIWRFAYSHNRDNLFTPAPMGYFDLGTDPLNQAADRASITLYRRGDMSPARTTIAVAMTEQETMEAPRRAHSVIVPWHELALVSRVGTVVTDRPAAPAGADLVLPLGWRHPATDWGANAVPLDPYATDTGGRLLGVLRERGLLPRRNVTNLAGPRLQSDNGQLTVDGPADVLTLNTPRTAGGYAQAGRRIRTAAVDVHIEGTDATVWVSSVDAQPISSSRRLIITHLTDLQNTGIRYADRARTVLLAWGGTPHLVRRGRATVTVRMANAARARVWGLSTSGRRLAPVAARVQGNALVVPLDVDAGGRARMLYEIEVPQ